MGRFLYSPLALLSSGLSLVAWAGEAKHMVHEQQSPPGSHAPVAAIAPPKALATLRPLGANQVGGTVAFTQEGDKVKAVADVTGLKPGAKHGFHIHEFGDCSAADGTSAGGHYNPQGHPHAGPKEGSRHAGDFGNLVADAAGKAHLELLLDNVTIAASPTSVLGRGIIVHAGEDDLKTQPTGNAGARIACGVIGASK